MSQQVNLKGYQPSNTELAQEEEQFVNLVDVLGGGALTAGAGAGIIAERARRRQQTAGGSFKDNYTAAAKDIAVDLKNAGLTVAGRTPFDIKEKSGEAGIHRSMYDYSATRPSNDPYFLDTRASKGYVSNPLTQAAVAARDAFNPSSEDFLSVSREMRRERGESSEGPRSQVAMQRIPLLDAVRDLLPERVGGFSDAVKADRADKGIGLLKTNSAQSAGSLVGRAASDFVNNGVRSLWWLVNAPQAVSDLISEELTARANREGLYGLDYFLEDEAKRRGLVDEWGNPKNTHVGTVKYDSKDPYADPQLARRVQELRQQGQTGDRLYSRRRVGNNLSTLLALPSAIAINSGLGLNNPFGGDEGRKAVFPTEEDPTKTDNVIAEVASKYILGRQGDILPWEEFKKVRPDVSKGEYMAYKGYRFNKKEDYNLLDDGKVNIGNGVLKYNNDGLDGPEVFFLGKSLPLTTTILPTAAAIGGAALGTGLARYGAFNIDGVNEAIRRKRTERSTNERVIDEIGEQLLNNYGPENEIPDAMKKREAAAIKRGQKLTDQIKRQESRLDFMENNKYASPVFKRLRNTRAIPAGLAAGFAGLASGTLIGNEIERRRREGKIEEREQRGY